MKKLIVLSFAALAALVVAANETETTKKHTPEQIREAIKRISLKKTGGVIRQANSAKGTFVVLNAQKAVPADRFTEAIAAIDHWMRVQVAVKETNGVDVATVKAAIAASGGTVGLALVESDTLPTLLTAPESGWSLVNVKALAKDGPDADRLSARVRKEILRAFAFVTGGAYANKSDFVMRDVTSPVDLDRLGREAFGIELINLIPEIAPKYGLTPWRQSTYRKACEDGWAPAPTNDFQKAIFDEVKSEKERGPANALQIKP